MNIVVTGGTGALGTALRSFLPDSARFLNRRDCDVRDAARVALMLGRLKPDVVLHAAALTNHQHPNAAEVIDTNIMGTRNVARWCRAADVRLVYTSTHYVYGGNAPEGGWTELDAPAPIGTYAWSKLAGEHWTEMVRNALVVRGSWYTPAKVRAWAERGALVDAWCTREPTRDAARKVAALALSDARGVVNIAGPERTFHDIARAELPGDAVQATTLAELDRGDAPYPFPRRNVVCAVRFDGMRARIGL